MSTMWYEHLSKATFLSVLQSGSTYKLNSGNNSGSQIRIETRHRDRIVNSVTNMLLINFVASF